MKLMQFTMRIERNKEKIHSFRTNSESRCSQLDPAKHEHKCSHGVSGHSINSNAFLHQVLAPGSRICIKCGEDDQVFDAHVKRIAKEGNSILLWCRDQRSVLDSPGRSETFECSKNEPSFNAEAPDKGENFSAISTSEEPGSRPLSCSSSSDVKPNFSESTKVHHVWSPILMVHKHVRKSSLSPIQNGSAPEKARSALAAEVVGQTSRNTRNCVGVSRHLRTISVDCSGDKDIAIPTARPQTIHSGDVKHAKKRAAENELLMTTSSYGRIKGLRQGRHDYEVRTSVDLDDEKPQSTLNQDSQVPDRTYSTTYKNGEDHVWFGNDADASRKVGSPSDIGHLRTLSNESDDEQDDDATTITSSSYSSYSTTCTNSDFSLSPCSSFKAQSRKKRNMNNKKASGQSGVRGKQKRKEAECNTKGTRLPIEQVDVTSGKTLETFQTEQAAAIKVGTTSKAIIRALGKRGKASAGGYFWRYQGDSRRTWRKPVRAASKPVEQVCPSTGKVIAVHSSIRAAKKALGLTTHAHISQACAGKRLSAAGFVWRCRAQDHDVD